MPDGPLWAGDDHPMVNINFDDCKAYCTWLSKTTGKNYRLPTEAEWEYAARGGNKSKGFVFAGSNDLDEVGSNSDKEGQTLAGGLKITNELGLYDMSGNVWEWCSDWYDASYYGSSPAKNPKGPATGSKRVLRGGSWFTQAEGCRVTGRQGSSPSHGDFTIGFRVVVI